MITVNLGNVNEAPIVTPATFWLAENSANGLAVGIVTYSDPEMSQAHTFAITGGNTGGALAIDATSGEIAVLNSAAVDFETNPGLSLTVQVTDDGAPPLSGSATVQINLTDVNESPTDITLSNAGANENLPSGSAVGQFAAVDLDAGQTHTFALVTGDGDADNGSFTIAGSSLRTADIFDFETKSSYTIRVQVTDNGSPSLSFEKQLAITVNDVNEAPVVSVATFTLPENSANATTVGSATYDDPDGGQTHTFAIAAGNSGGAFAINAGTGEITVANSATLDFETTPTFSLTVEVADSGSPALSGSATVTIDLLDGAGGPSDILLSHASVPETALVGTVVGTFTTIDPEGPHTYALVAGDGDTDNASFQIAVDALLTAESLDYEVKKIYSIRVQATDNTGQVFAKKFTILVTDVQERGSTPTDITLSNRTVNENQPAGTLVGSFSTIGPGAGDAYTYSLVAGTGDTDNTSFQISGNQLLTGAAFDFEAKNGYTIRVRTTDSGTPAQSLEKQFIVSVNDVNEAPTGIALSNAGVNENQPLGTIVGTLSGTDPDAGQTLTFSLRDLSGDNASFQIIGTTLRTAAVLDHESKDSYTIQVRATDNGSPAQFFDKQLTIGVNDINDAPVAAPDTFSPNVALGNTLLSVGVTTSGQPVVNITGNLLANDTDQEGTPLTAVAEKVPSTGGGTATINTNGSFTFLPGIGDRSHADTFTYHVSDGTAKSAGTVTVGIASSLVWYVNNATSNGDGRSNAPLTTLAAAEAASGPDDIIFVYEGNTVKKPLGGGIVLKDRQKLHGQGVGLVVPGFGTLVPAGNRPRINNTAGDAVSVPATAGHRDAVEVRGLDLQGSSNAIDVTAGVANNVGVILSDNTIRGAGAEGIDLNAGSTGSFIATVQNNTITATGNGIDARSSAATALVLALNTNTGITSGATGILVDGSGGGTATITSFVGNNVSGATAGAGISINGATFDATPGGSFQTVAAGVTAVGAAGNGVGGAGLLLTHSAGDLSFSDLDIIADGGAGLRASGLAPYTGSAGLQLAVGSDVATVTAMGGPALDLDTVGAALPFQTISSTNSPTTGVALNSVTGSLSAGAASSISNISSAAGTAFQVADSSATIVYAGTINTSTGKGVVLTGNAGGSIGLSGTLTLNTGADPAFEATGGGTVTATDSANTLTTTTGTALKVANTTIGAAGLKFRSISAGTTSTGPVNGIVLDNTGTAGGLTVSGTGSVGSGGTIQRADTGVNLNNTSNVSLSYLQLNDFADYTIRGTGVTNFALANTTVSGSSGDSTAAFEGGVQFDGLVGTASITNSSFSGSLLHNFRVTNSGGILDRITFSNDTFGLNNTASGDDGLQLEASGSAVMNVTVQDSFFTGSAAITSSSRRRRDAAAVRAISSSRATRSPTTIRGSSPAAAESRSAGRAVASPTWSRRIRCAMRRGIALVVSCGGAGSTCRGTVWENKIGVSDAANSGSAGGSGIAMISAGGGTFITAVIVNQVYQYNNHGILLQTGDRQGSTLNLQASVMDNTVSNPGNMNSNFNGIHLNNGTVATDNFTSCVDIVRNKLTGAGQGAVSPDNADLRLRQRQGTAVRLPGYGGANNDNAAVQTLLSGQNTLGTVNASNSVPTGGGYVGGATCTWP